MAYDGMYSDLSTRGSANEILNQAMAVRDEVEADRQEVAADAAEVAANKTSVDTSEANIIVLHGEVIDANTQVQAALADINVAQDSVEANKTAAEAAQVAAELARDEAQDISDAMDVKLVSLKSIVEYGAVADGVTDCSSAILASYAEKGYAWIPTGSFAATLTTANATQFLLALTNSMIDGRLAVTASAGSYARSAPVLIEKTSTGYLSFQGATPASVSILGQVSVSGSAGAYSVVLQLDNAFGIQANEAIHTWSVVGTGSAPIHRGMWRITSVDTLNNRITVLNTCYKASFPTNTITSSNSVILKSIFNFSDCDGFVVKSSKIDFLDKVAIFGNSDSYWNSGNVSGTEKGTHGLYIGAMTIALNGKADNTNQYGVSLSHVSCGPYVGINGFDQQGICVELSGTFWGDFVSSCNNKRRGFYSSTAAGIRSKHVSANGNFLDGLISDLGGSIYASSESCACGNGRTGASSTQSGMIILDGGYFYDNGGHGGSAVEGGVLQATGAIYRGNLLNGVFAEYGGVVYCNDSDMSSNGQNGQYAAFGSHLRANNCTVNNNTLFGTRVDDYSVVNNTGTIYSGNGSGDLNLTSGGTVRNSTTLGGEIYGEDLRIRNITTRNGVRLATTSDGVTLAIQYDGAAADSYSGGYNMSSNSNGLRPSDDGVKNLGLPSAKWNAVNAVSANFTGPIKPGQYTLATLPNASTFNSYEIDVTDATGGPKRCRSNGTVWQILNTTTTVS